MLKNNDNLSLDKLIKKNSRKIGTILEESRTSEKEFTHVSLGGKYKYKGKFNISDANLKKLNSYLAFALDNSIHYSLAEKPKEYGPIKVDIDLQISKEHYKNERLYSDQLIKESIKEYRKAIKHYCDVEDYELDCFVFEKDSVIEKDDTIKDGVHLIFPNITLNFKVRHLVYDKVIKETKKKQIFNTFMTTPIFDKQIISSNNWMIYGCAKPDKSPYLLTSIYDIDFNKKTDEYTSKDLIKKLSLRNKRWKKENETLLSDIVDETLINNEYNKINTSFESSEDSDMIDISNSESTLYETKEIKEATILVSMMNDQRADSYELWIRVGFALHNINKKLLNCWIEFSKKSSKFEEGECQKLWRNMRNNDYTINSLYKWAKDDNPKEYKEFIKKRNNELLKKNSLKDHFGTAMTIFEMYKTNFVCIDPGKNIWYKFENHRWKPDPVAAHLSVIMSTEVVENIKEIGRELYNNKDMEHKEFQQLQKKYNEMMESLLDGTHKDKILKQCRNIFYTYGHGSEFTDKIDEKHHLIGFENGVFDLQTGEFRDGEPDDFITKTVKYDYLPYNVYNPVHKNIKQFFCDIFPNETVKEYVLLKLASCVSGEVTVEKFNFCTGSGSNGKSLLFSFINEVFGEYYVSCPITILTKKRNASNAASPELVRIKGARIAVYQEPGKDEELNVGIFKEITGNDKFMVRGLYQDPIEIKPQVKHFMTCNTLPSLPSLDGGTVRRLEVLNFGEKFVDKPDPENPHEKKINENLKHEIKDWVKPFMGYLIDLYITEVRGNKILPPPEVNLSTNKYVQENDVFKEWYDNNIECTKNKNDYIKKKEISDHFKRWYNDIYGSKTPSSKDLYIFLEQSVRLECHPKKGWRGVVIIDSDSDSDSGNSDTD